jgi:hypothetical protein
MTCSHDPQETYRQAGTDDPEKTAAWLAEGSRQGEAYDGTYEGCLDGLSGKPNRFAPTEPASAATEPGGGL